ncbi:hypothetical protein AX16_007853 [Volvariella volvacea WC 439]|nr:hypothetical protein AX16_007853 [Volvariella volvacea WC 439]
MTGSAVTYSHASGAQNRLPINPQDSDELPNILIFGETGVGKSAIINMLAGRTVALASDQAQGCTSNCTSYDVSIGDFDVRLWDTAGLNEAEGGTVGAEDAERQLIELVGDRLRGKVALLAYCIRGVRFRKVVQLNYDLIHRTVCQMKVPIVLIITGLENEERMESWWEANKADFDRRGLTFDGHACITTTKGKRLPDGSFIYETEYNHSESLIRKLVLDHFVAGNVIFDERESWKRSIRRGLKAHDKASGRLEDMSYGHHSWSQSSGHPSSRQNSTGAYYPTYSDDGYYADSRATASSSGGGWTSYFPNVATNAYNRGKDAIVKVLKSGRSDEPEDDMDPRVEGYDVRRRY